jgi:hypothetical protein
LVLKSIRTVASEILELKYITYAMFTGTSKNMGSNNFKYNFRFFLNKKTGKRKTNKLNRKVISPFKYSWR